MVIKGAFAGYSLAVKQITYDSLVINYLPSAVYFITLMIVGQSKCLKQII